MEDILSVIMKRLDNQSYSQSNPGAVMERRWVRREIEKNERKLIELRENVYNSKNAPFNSSRI